jgi:hypothetical protein
MNYQHHELAAGQWDTLSLIEQMGNIGSEVERALRWKEKGNQEYAMRAMDRVLELFTLTLHCSGNKGRLREIARAKETLLDYFFGENMFMSTEGSLKKYFFAFAFAARIAHDAAASRKRV